MQDPNPTDARRLGRTCEGRPISGLLGLVMVLGVRDVLAPLSVSFGRRRQSIYCLARSSHYTRSSFAFPRFHCYNSRSTA